MSDVLKVTKFSQLINWSVQYLLQNTFSYNEDYKLVSIGSFLTRNKTSVVIEDDITYKRVTIKINNGGVYLRDTEKGSNIGTKKQFTVQEGQFLLSKIDARNGAFGVVPTEVDNAIITGNFWTFDVDYSQVNPHFLALIVTTKKFINFCSNASNGTTNRHYLQEELFLEQKIPLPSLEEQNRLVTNYNEKITLAEQQEGQATNIKQQIEDYLFDELGIEKLEKKKTKKGLQFVYFTDISNWSTSNSDINKYKSKKYQITSIVQNSSLAISVFRGKSPKYSDNGTKFILNQKCNRWNEIDQSFIKKVDDSWFTNIDESFFTRHKDILINSTGEGTIGRATYITVENEKLLYDSHLLLVRFGNTVNAMFYTYLFNSSYGQNQVDNIKSAQSTKQTELGVANLKKIVFPLPPIEIQNEIVEHVTALKEQIKDLQQKAKTNRAKAISDFEKEIFAE